MSASGKKRPVSLSLDEKIIKVTGEADEINRSSLANSLMEEWLEEHGYL